MSFTGAAGANIVRVVDGRTYRLAKPTRDQVGQQIAIWAAEDKKRLAEILEESGASPEFKFTVLRRHDEESRLVSYGMRCAMEFTRSGDVVAAAAGTKPNDLPFGPDGVVDLALELWGLNGPPSQALPVGPPTQAAEDLRPLELGPQKGPTLSAEEIEARFPPKPATAPQIAQPMPASGASTSEQTPEELAMADVPHPWAEPPHTREQESESAPSEESGIGSSQTA
jgi:hypothetical protein